MAVDDDLFVREHLRDYLAASTDLVLVATCSSGAEAVEMVRRNPPDVVLMDIQMPIMDGIQATAAIGAIAPAVKVVALTSFGDDDAVAEMLNAGAAGFLIKNTKPQALIQAIKAAHNGLTVYPADPIRRWGQSRRRPVAPVLTERERQVLDLLAAGLNNRQIGQAMFVSASTVKNHLSDLMDKLDAPSRIGVVARAHELGLLTRRDT
ncbi:MAG: response regulator transcription factor [Propionicimonas sp.]|uniref:response regulator n=1 Tax=Propionicimonas sp. TaxID=1955623 RepID=UPI003D0AB865